MFKLFISTVWILFIIWIVIAIIINIKEYRSFKKFKEVCKCTGKELKRAKQEYEMGYHDFIDYSDILENEWLFDIVTDNIAKDREEGI